jgi:hypothetical protein
MEAALFTLDVALLVVLIWSVRRSDCLPPSERNLGLLSFLTSKTDAVQKGFRERKD